MGRLTGPSVSNKVERMVASKQIICSSYSMMDGNGIYYNYMAIHGYYVRMDGISRWYMETNSIRCSTVLLSVGAGWWIPERERKAMNWWWRGAQPLQAKESRNYAKPNQDISANLGLSASTTTGVALAL